MSLYPFQMWDKYISLINLYEWCKIIFLPALIKEKGKDLSFHNLSILFLCFQQFNSVVFSFLRQVSRFKISLKKWFCCEVSYKTCNYDGEPRWWFCCTLVLLRCGQVRVYLFHLNISIFGRREKHWHTFFLMDETICSDLEAFTCFYAIKWYKFSRKLLQRNRRVFEMSLVIAGLLV